DCQDHAAEHRHLVHDQPDQSLIPLIGIHETDDPQQDHNKHHDDIHKEGQAVSLSGCLHIFGRKGPVPENRIGHSPHQPRQETGDNHHRFIRKQIPFAGIHGHDLILQVAEIKIKKLQSENNNHHGENQLDGAVEGVGVNHRLQAAADGVEHKDYAADNHRDPVVYAKDQLQNIGHAHDLGSRPDHIGHQGRNAPYPADLGIAPEQITGDKVGHGEVL